MNFKNKILNYNANEAIAHLRGHTPRYIPMPEEPDCNDYWFDKSGKYVALRENLGKNIHAILDGLPREQDESEILAGLTDEEINDPATAIALIIRNHFIKQNQRRMQ